MKVFGIFPKGMYKEVKNRSEAEGAFILCAQIPLNDKTQTDILSGKPLFRYNFFSMQEARIVLVRNDWRLKKIEESIYEKNTSFGNSKNYFRSFLCKVESKQLEETSFWLEEFIGNMLDFDTSKIGIIVEAIKVFIDRSNANMFIGKDVLDQPFDLYGMLSEGLGMRNLNLSKPNTSNDFRRFTEAEEREMMTEVTSDKFYLEEVLDGDVLNRWNLE